MTFRYDVSRSGLDLMRDIDRAVEEIDPDAMIPMFASNTERGRTRFKARAGDRHLNPFGIAHGGFTCGLLDTAAAMAAHSTVEPHSFIVTVDLTVRFLRSIQPGAELDVEGWTTHASKQLIVAEASIKDGDARLLATGSAVFLVKAIAPE